MFSALTKHFLFQAKSSLTKKYFAHNLLKKQNQFALQRINMFYFSTHEKTAEAKNEENAEKPNVKKGETKKEETKKEEAKKEENKKEETKKEEHKHKEDKGDEVSAKKFNELKSQYNELTVKAEQYRHKLEEILKFLEENIAEKDLIKVRLEKEKENSKHYAISKFAKDILDVCDNFDRAKNSIQDKDFATIPEEEKKEIFLSFVEGVEMTQKCFHTTLKRHGVTTYAPVAGEKFDPAKHEAVEVVEDTKKPNETIDSVVFPGYNLNNKLLRPARVNVVKKK